MDLLLGAGMALGTAACTDEILDVRPTDEYTDADVWNDLGLVDQYVNLIYTTLPDNYTLLDCNGLSDEAFNTHNYCGARVFNTGEISSTDMTGWNPWTAWRNPPGSGNPAPPNHHWVNIRRTNETGQMGMGVATFHRAP